MNSEVEISHVHTTCRNCVFARFEDKKQTSCSLDKTADYKNAGVEILEVFDDTDTEFNLINGRFCLFYRNLELMEKYPRDTWEDIVRLETKVPYQIIVFFNENDTLLTLKSIIKKIKAQDIQPNQVTVINKQYPFYSRDPEKYIKPSELLEQLSVSELYKYSLKNVYDESLSDRSLIDLVFDSTKSQTYPFYIVFKADFDLKQQFSKEFNDAILIEMLQLGFVRPVDDLNGMIVSRIAHKKHSGNSFEINLEDKILAEEDNGEQFIYKVQDVCPTMKS